MAQNHLAGAKQDLLFHEFCKEATEMVAWLNQQRQALAVAELPDSLAAALTLKRVHGTLTVSPLAYAIGP
jgi:hypothetical protein